MKEVSARLFTWKNKTEIPNNGTTQAKKQELKLKVEGQTTVYSGEL